MSNVFVASPLIDRYGKCRSLKDARNVFDKMPQRDDCSWTDDSCPLRSRGGPRKVDSVFPHASNGSPAESLYFCM